MLIQPSLDSCLARVIDFFDGYNFLKLTSNYQKKKNCYFSARKMVQK